MRHALVLRNLVGNASAPLIRAAAFRQVGLYLTRAEQGGAQGCEDWDLYLRIAEGFNIRVVPDYLVAYRQTGSSMSANAEAMAASFGVTLRRARERGRDLPSAAFRWSAGYFYLYLAQKCHLWGRYGRCLRYLNAAVWANPPLLLKTAVYRRWLESLWLAFTRLAPPARPLPEGKANGVRLPLMSAKAEKKCPFISNALFERLELARWAAAWNEGD